MGKSSSATSFETWLRQDSTILWSTVVGFVIALVMIVRYLRNSSSKSTTSIKSSPQQTLHLIQNRRSISPKDYLPCADHPVSDIELETLLEAANWAPTHGKTEPWRYVVLSGQDAIMEYLQFLDNWYSEKCDQLTEESLTKFRNKYASIVSQWSQNVSHLIILVMKRKALPDKLMPEWEELCACAMAVQNIHLMATSLNLGLFWSSHTWCKDARESKELKEHFNFLEEDKILGALTVGRYDLEKRFTSTRRPVKSKVQYF